MSEKFVNNPPIFNQYLENFSKGYDFTIKYAAAMYNASLMAMGSFVTLPSDTEAKNIRNTVMASFDSYLRKALEEESFASSLADYLDIFVENMRLTRHNIAHQMFDSFFSFWNNSLEPFRDSINRTSSEIIPMEGHFDLLHYKSEQPIKQKTPLLIVGSLINRYYILDLLPKISIIKKFQQAGFDVYATDWRTPKSYDKDMTLDSYARQYLEYAVEKVQEITCSKKISLFGYCWGGIFALIHAAIHPWHVKNLILHATPTDLETEPTSVELWTKKINADHLVSVFGNIPGSFLNAAFLMRNPVEAFLKHLRFFGEPRTIDEIERFFSIEMWLYDSRPIIGEVFRKIVDDIYKNNLLIKNKMKVGEKLVDLKKITMPVLNIVGEKDDLVPPQSSRTINDVIDSKDKKLLEFPTGHVGLCISSTAHERLWPDVVEWLALRS